MTTFDVNEEREQYRLLMVLPRQNSVLMDRTGEKVEMPSITIPRYARPAEQITTAVLAKWALDSVVIDWHPGTSGATRCALLEIDSLSSRPSSSEGLCLIRIDDVSDETVPSALITSTQKMLAGNASGGGPFSRFGWIEDAKQWIQDSVRGEQVEFASIRQLNASRSFALLRFATTSGRAYWLKAVGPPNAHEFTTTSYLAKHCHEYLPRIIAFRSDWNAWVMEEFGASLSSSSALGDFELATMRLAELQKQLAGRPDELLAARFVDHRVDALASHIDELIDYLGQAMSRKPEGKGSPIAPHRLREIGSLLHDGCDRMGDLNIPVSVMHSDISPGSILSDGTNCVFTDWCEAYVGNPFITLEQLCVHVARKTDDPQAWARSLRSVYKSSWMDVLQESQIDRALQLVPLISVLSYLYNRGDWLQASRRYEPGFESYSRSLAHHMDRISAGPEFLEALCRLN